MEVIHGRRTTEIGRTELLERAAGAARVIVDLGTGDGRFVAHLAQQHPADLVIGVDACREQLRDVSRRAPGNALFVIANALALPRELDALAAQLWINFPWGSLLRSLLDGDPALLTGLERIARPGATLTVRLNGGALAEAGTTFEHGGSEAQRSLRAVGIRVGALEQLDVAALRALPSSWAKRLAFGRDPRAIQLRAMMPADARQEQAVLQSAAA